MADSEPTVSLYDDPAAFMGDAAPFLLANEAKNSLPIGVVNAIIRAPSAHPDPWLAVVRAGERITGAFVRTPPFRLILSEGTAPVALAPVVTHLAAAPADLPGVTGGLSLAGAFARAWTAQTGIPAREDRRLRIYALSSVILPPAPAGALRQATPDDRELAIDWFLAFHDEADGGHAMTRERIGPLIDSRLGSTETPIWLWEVDGEPVSLVGITGATPHTRRIGPVYTPPACRRRGYASATTAAVSQRLLEAGMRQVVLYADLANPTTNHIYQAMGYQPLLDTVDITFEPAA